MCSFETDAFPLRLFRRSDSALLCSFKSALRNARILATSLSNMLSVFKNIALKALTESVQTHIAAVLNSPLAKKMGLWILASHSELSSC